MDSIRRSSCFAPGCKSNIKSMKRLRLRLLVLVAPVLAAQARAAGPIRFEDVASVSGVDFRFDDGARGKHDLPEIMGGGVALIDADGDGRLDLFLCDGGPIAEKQGRNDPPCRLYRNRGAWKFDDVTASASCPGPSYAMGCAVGDFDGDRRDDLFVTGWRDQRLYRNAGGGRFEDVTARAGLLSKAWSTSAAFADLDRDGDLDLYVCNYLDYDPDRAPFCAAPDGKRDFCGPEVFPPQPHRLYRNNGNGTFTDISAESGIAMSDGRGLGVLVADLVGDDRLDLFVANDGTPCRLFEGLGGLRFVDVGAKQGVALDGAGGPIAAMGVALGDLNGDSYPDLVVGNFLGRSTIAFRGLAGGPFQDVSSAWGLTAATRDVLGFGVALADFDGDGALDLLQANGHVLDRERLGVPFAMRPTLLRNQAGRLVDAAGNGFERPILGRGVAIGDLDNDGRPDAVVAALRAPVAVLRNVSEGSHWLAIHLQGKGQAIGARLTVELPGRTLTRVVIGGGGYLAASSRVVQVGLGNAERAERIEVRWPSGLVEEFGPVNAGNTTLVEGAGRWKD